MMRLWNFEAVLLLFGVLYNNGVKGGTFMTSRPSTLQQRSCCEGISILTCDEIKVDLNVLGDEELYLEPLNTTLQYQGLVPISSNSYHYSNKEVDFTLTAIVELGSVYGQAAFKNGKSYVIEFCGNNVHVLKELDVENMGDAEGVDTMDKNTNTTNYRVKRQISCRIQGKFQIFRHEYNGGGFSEYNCFVKCEFNSECHSWFYNNRNRDCYLLVGKQYYSTSFSNGPTMNMNKKSCNLYKPCTTCTNFCRIDNSVPFVRSLGSSSASSSEACQIMCELDSSCTQWNYQKSGTSGTCYKYQLFTQWYSGWSSGPKFC